MQLFHWPSDIHTLVQVTSVYTSNFLLYHTVLSSECAFLECPAYTWVNLYIAACISGGRIMIMLYNLINAMPDKAAADLASSPSAWQQPKQRILAPPVMRTSLPQ